MHNISLIQALVISDSFPHLGFWRLGGSNWVSSSPDCTVSGTLTSLCCASKPSFTTLGTMLSPHSGFTAPPCSLCPLTASATWPLQCHGSWQDIGVYRDTVMVAQHVDSCLAQQTHDVLESLKLWLLTAWSRDWNFGFALGFRIRAAFQWLSWPSWLKAWIWILCTSTSTCRDLEYNPQSVNNRLYYYTLLYLEYNPRYK